ncbi:hypothetical protein NDU88_006123 [Pleurodeles waltl]|uniref:Uncharacterized protein n=1 Tax=Pleurodeles waltl TaxID=8319 RepID=A0AAV7MD04_PLEWA|nr:hypothetical protein NDU88_006123 [Pleurodeles waltl]
MSRSRPQKVKTVQSVQPVIVMDDDDLDDDGNGDGYMKARILKLKTKNVEVEPAAAGRCRYQETAGIVFNDTHSLFIVAWAPPARRRSGAICGPVKVLSESIGRSHK